MDQPARTLDRTMADADADDDDADGSTTVTVTDELRESFFRLVKCVCLPCAPSRLWPGRG